MVLIKLRETRNKKKTLLMKLMFGSRICWFGEKILMNLMRSSKLVRWSALYFCISSVAQGNSEISDEHQRQHFEQSFEFAAVVQPRQHDLVFGGFHIGTMMVQKTTSELFRKGNHFHAQLNFASTHAGADELQRLYTFYYKFPVFLQDGESRIIDASGDYITLKVKPLTGGQTDDDSEFSGEFDLGEGFGSFKGIEGYCNYNRTMPFAGAALLRGSCYVNR